MRFGYFFMPLHQPEEDPTLGIESDLRTVELAEELGYDEFWIGEHHTGGWETIPSPEMFLAAASQRTSRIRLGTGVISAPFHNPLEVAERVSLLDHLSRGRLMVGLGPGLLPTDFRYWGATTSLNRERIHEQIEILKKLLHGNEPVTHHGTHYDLDDAWLQLRPYQSRLPIAITTSGPASSSTELAAKYDLMMISGNFIATPGVVLREHPDALELRAAHYGTSTGRHNWRLATYVYVAETTKQAFDDIRVGAERFAKRYLTIMAPFLSQVFEDYKGQPLAEIGIEQLARKCHWIIGDPDDVAAQLDEFNESAGGIEHLLIIGGGWQPHHRFQASMDLFARYVMPRFRGSNLGMGRAFERLQASPIIFGDI